MSSSNVLEEKFAQFRVDASGCGICGTNFKVSTDERLPMSHDHEENEEDRQEGNQEMEGTSPDEDMETADAHRNTHAHFKKATEFQQYQDLYLQNVHPCLTKEDKLRQMLEDPSLAGKKTQVEFDFERLEGFHFRVKSEVQTIESSLDWTNISSLNDALKVFQVALQETERIVEQGNLGRYNFIVIFIGIQVVPR
ncbi:TPR and ankyrin repeat-containing protein 1 [Desmophyllum pertusum]|uniref:TPR and ankyrin repeat-containing protein 1 n=1 Tax=Desmophyllum pertusum TaxID=174260 RepID=A0A9W9Z151_9CNID|nr:TPR and ankyrin repeat-containing protein 1 [Desmophyllum pertusum]